ncbi:RHS repeat-associated core domain-containing protein [Dactylosporangium sp. CA-092794]|uniref:RHS repeat-associated core domain-containing protein n=1 Tax=Dactylosporangium sp. CA-092794 TaxID=3239929 RepID=UPI003D940178
MITNTGEVLRPIRNFGGVSATYTSTTGTSWQITNLHGDLVAGIAPTGFGLAYTGDFTELGQPHNPTSEQRGYGWLGAAQRWSDTPGGMALMGVRLYSPTTGRFLSSDPVYGGNANPYDYCHGDAVNCGDTSGMASCRRTGSWSRRWLSFRAISARCYISDWTIQDALKRMNFYAAVYGIVAAVLAFLGITWVAAAFGLASAIVWALGAWADWRYHNKCRGNGLNFDIVAMVAKWPRFIFWWSPVSVRCA